ncbi:hypothetical protein Tco_0330974 [Tanacetum coccineum]
MTCGQPKRYPVDPSKVESVQNWKTLSTNRTPFNLDWQITTEDFVKHRAKLPGYSKPQQKAKRIRKDTFEQRADSEIYFINRIWIPQL